MSRYARPGRPAARLAVSQLESRENPNVGFQAFGAAAGGLPLVEVTHPNGTTIARFEAFDAAFRGGVRTAVAELDGDPNTLEIITGAGPGGGPHVKVFQLDLATNNLTELAGFFAFEPGFTGGVRVAAGNVGGFDARQEIIVGAEAGGGPRVRVFGLEGDDVVPVAGPLSDFFAFEPGFRGGVRVAAGELDGDPLTGDELVVAAGIGGGPRVRVLRSDGAELSSHFAFREDFLGGVSVAVDRTGGVGRLLMDDQLDDFSQRNATLNTAAFAAVAPPPTAAILSGPGGAPGTPGGPFTTESGPVSSPGTLPVISPGAQAGLLGGGAPLIGGGAPLINQLGIGLGTGLGTFSSFGATGPFGLGGSRGVFGTAGPLSPFPPLFSPPFAGTFTGVGGFGTGANLTGIVTGNRIVPIGG